MRSDITRQGFVSTPLIGHPGYQPAFSQGMENPVTVVNDNKPCNPEVPVYPGPQQ